MDLGYYGQMAGYGSPYSRPQVQFQQMQPQAQQTFPSMVVGKMIQSPNDIMPGDIPMNGTPCFFPMQDGSAIFMKAWSSDGSIATMKFLPKQAAPKEPTQLDRIENMLKSFMNNPAQNVSEEVHDAE